MEGALCDRRKTDDGGWAVRFAHDRILAALVTGFPPLWLQATPVIGRARSAQTVGSEAAIRFEPRAILWCNSGWK